MSPCADAVPGQRPDRGDHPGELRVVRVEPFDVRGGAPVERGDEPLLRPCHRPRGALVARRPSRRQHAVRQAEDLRGRAEVALQLDHPGVRVARREAGQVVARGPGEGVDGLVLVADDGKVVATAEPGVEERLLERVRVLVLVDREPPIARSDLGRHRVVALDQLHGHGQHVLEIDQPGTVSRPLVVAIEPRHQVRWERSVMAVRDDVVGIPRRPDPASLRPFDLGRQVPDGEIAVPTGQRPRQGHQQRRLRREDAWQVAIVDARPEMPELAQGGSVERERRHASPAGGGKTVAHLRRSLVREGDDQDVRRPDGFCGERIGDTARDHTGLARPGPGQDAERSTDRGHRLALGGIQVGEQGVRIEIGHRPRLYRRTLHWAFTRCIRSNGERK